MATSAIKNIDPNRYGSRDFALVGSLEQMNDLATRLITCWEAIRVQTKGCDAAQAAPKVGQLLRTYRVLPSSKFWS